MRDLYALLGVSPDASAQAIHAALDETHQHDAALADEAAAILLDPHREQQYRRVHQQFIAAARLFSNPELPDPPDNGLAQYLQSFSRGA